MQIGIHLTPFFSPTDRPPTQVVDEVVAIAHRVLQLGFAWISAPHHWAAHPSVWPQPFPLLARLASIRAPTFSFPLPLSSVHSPLSACRRWESPTILG
jgi:hypothetical protein